MLYNPKCICPLGKLSNRDFVDDTRAIQLALSSGAYNAVVPAPASVTPLIDQMEVYVEDNKHRNYKTVPLRKALRKQITAMLKLQCTSVNGLANGDIDFMFNSSFPLNKQPEPTQVPVKGQLRFITPLAFGEAFVYFYGIATRDYYEVKVTGPNGFIQITTGIHPKMKVADLPLNVTLQARVRGVNGKGQGEWSQPIGFLLSPEADQSNTSTN